MKSLDAREKMPVQFNAHLNSVDWRILFNLETVVGRGGVCGYGGAGQGAARRNGCSIPTSCNAALRLQNRAIRPVATSLRMDERRIYVADN